MYNIEKLKKWKDKVQQEIELLLEKHKIELESILDKELPKNYELIVGNGKVFLVTPKGKDIENDFIRELEHLCYNDYFDTGLCVKERNRRFK